MRKYTQKDLRYFVNQLGAVDLTNKASNEIYEIAKNHTLEQVGYSCGVYGCNGKLFQDINTGDYYAITSRTQAIFCI